MSQSSRSHAAMNGARQEENNLRELWRFLGRNRWLIALVLAGVLAATAAFLVVTPRIYEATASIRIDEQRSNLAVLDALRTLQSGSEISTEMEVLRSRSLAEDVVRSNQLQLELVRPLKSIRTELISAIHVDTAAPAAEYRLDRTEEGLFVLTSDDVDLSGGPYPVGQPIPLARAEVTLSAAASNHESIVLSVMPFQERVKRFRKVLSVTRPNREAQIVVVRYEHRDPLVAYTVANGMAARFIRQRQETMNSEALGTVRFMREQLDSLEIQLAVAENDFRAFRERNRVIEPVAEAEAKIRQIAEFQAHRDLAEAERAALARRLEQIEATPREAGEVSPYRGLLAFPSLLRNPAASELLNSLNEVENRRVELLDRRRMNDPEVVVITERIHELEAQLRSLAVSYLRGLSEQVRSYNQRLTSFDDQLERIPQQEVQYARLKRQAGILEEIYTLLQTRLKEAEIVAAVEDPSVRVVDPAIVPREPIKPRVPFSIFLALVIGLVAGVGAAFGREHLDNAVHTRDDLQLVTGGSPILGQIPRIREAAMVGNGASRHRHAASRGLQERLVTGRDPRNAVSEAYRSLRTNISFSQPDSVPKTLVFTSALPGDGKSTSASNLAITLAQQDLQCILIDGDLRRGVLNEVFDAPKEPGLSQVLLGRVPLDDAIHHLQVGDHRDLAFMPTGIIPPNPAELVASDRMGAILTDLARRFDYVIIDAPPLNMVTDAALLGTKADGVVFVARSGTTDRDAIEFAMEQLDRVRAKLLGTVLNDVDVKKGAYYGGYAGHTSGYFSES